MHHKSNSQPSLSLELRYVIMALLLTPLKPLVSKMITWDV
jgi:hypothetical protein